MFGFLICVNYCSDPSSITPHQTAHMHSLIGLAMGNPMHLSEWDGPLKTCFHESSDIHLSEMACCTIHQQCHMNHVACVLHVWELTHQ